MSDALFADRDRRPTARRVLVSGAVQGVFFRDSCRRIALGSGVAGWVRNWSDGSVEAWFEGSVEPVHRLVAWCREGPAGASVTSIEVSEVDPSGEVGFRVR
ncbi:MAG: acylphosphatase [Actinomycetota bacterium]|nr:acylphosphatase [Actinomycetota bacterium]